MQPVTLHSVLSPSIPKVPGTAANGEDEEATLALMPCLGRALSPGPLCILQYRELASDMVRLEKCPSGGQEG